jgi:hypothetical protein
MYILDGSWMRNVNLESKKWNRLSLFGIVSRFGIKFGVFFFLKKTSLIYNEIVTENF